MRMFINKQWQKLKMLFVKGLTLKDKMRIRGKMHLQLFGPDGELKSRQLIL